MAESTKDCHHLFTKVYKGFSTYFDVAGGPTTVGAVGMCREEDVVCNWLCHRYGSLDRFRKHVIDL